MKCLTVCQPWAWALIHGPKRIENRSWKTNYRGPLLIHAGKSRSRLGDFGHGEPLESELIFGAIIGQVILNDCLSIEECRGLPFAEGPYCFVTGNPLSIKPIPYQGRLYLYDVSDEVVAGAISDAIVGLPTNSKDAGFDLFGATVDDQRLALAKALQTRANGRQILVIVGTWIGGV